MKKNIHLICFLMAGVLLLGASCNKKKLKRPTDSGKAAPAPGAQLDKEFVRELTREFARELARELAKQNVSVPTTVDLSPAIVSAGPEVQFSSSETVKKFYADNPKCFVITAIIN